MEERVWVGVVADGDTDEERVEVALAGDPIDEIRERDRADLHSDPNVREIVRDLTRCREPRRLVRRGDRELERHATLVAHTVAVVVLPIGGIEHRPRIRDGEGDPRDVTYEGPGARGHELVGDAPPPIGRDLQHAPTVDRRRDGLPHDPLAEDRSGRAHVEEERGEVIGRQAEEVDGLERPGAARVLRRESGGPIDLSARECRKRLATVPVGAQHDLVEVGAAAAGLRPIEVVVPREGDLSRVHLRHAEGTGADGSLVERLTRELTERHVLQKMFR